MRLLRPWPIPPRRSLLEQAGLVKYLEEGKGFPHDKPR